MRDSPEDRGQMRFGIFGGPARTETNTDSDAYREFIEMVTEAEQAGFFGDRKSTRLNSSH